MAKFNVSLFHVEQPLAPLTPAAMDYSRYKPCAEGAEFSIGMVNAGPVPGNGFEWVTGGARIWQFVAESRKVPDKWMDAEYLRRITGKDLTAEERLAIRDQTKAELWEKIVPTHKHGWAAYLPEASLLIVCAPVRLVEEITSCLRGAIGRLPIKTAWQPSAFEAMVKDMINRDCDEVDEELRLGKQVDMYDGSGREKVVVKFRNYDNLQENVHVADHMRQCKNVASAGFNLPGTYDGDDELDDFVSSKYAELAVQEVKDKEADQFGTILHRISVARTIAEKVQNVTDGYTSDNWREVL